MNIHLIPIDHSDLEFIRALRNSCRKSFFNTQPISMAQQDRWYDGYLHDLFRLMFVIWYDGQRVGTISRMILTKFPTGPFHINVYEVGHLMLLPAYRGRGLMLRALAEVTKLDPHGFYIAQVKPTNAASLRVFKRAGFWRVPKKRRPRVR